ncbi:DUF3299 domain-containing protein [Colwellia psychrerythraea]|uniref:Lipoprotein n=1 Tax=Colwellia psychrerythraea TaxID=28229 RepID=A0A099KDF7_COLPS|nr:DUF3299 domain-containing protein [Colwellia psychrerythraea]KGJ88360.1 Protein of unknown function DUF3299 [Colwellia psychrerythraea]
MLLLLGCGKPKEIQIVESKNINVISKEIAQKTSAVTKFSGEVKPVEKLEKTLPALTFMSAQWTDLMPKDDLDALLNPPDYIDEIAENSAEDQLNNADLTNKETNAGIITDSKENAYHQALASTRIIPAINDAAIRLPAYIVPLEFDDAQRVTQFFLVPFFGACIHLPPPPPNQTIFVNYPQGFTLESLYDPYWVSGVIKTSLVENDTAIAAYSMEVHALDIYTDE